MSLHTPSAYEVETYSGRYVDTSNPRVDTIDLTDIAHALSQICRYGGHCRVFYPVAEHSVFVSRRLERKGAPAIVCYEGLHHDDAEGYLGDIPRPTKGLLRTLGSAYDDLSDLMDNVICAYLTETFGVTVDPAHFHERTIKDADNWSLFVEARHLLPSRGINWSGSQLGDWGVRQDGLPNRIVTPDYFHGTRDVLPSDARQRYLDRHFELLGMIGGQD